MASPLKVDSCRAEAVIKVLHEGRWVLRGRRGVLDILRADSCAFLVRGIVL